MPTDRSAAVPDRSAGVDALRPHVEKWLTAPPLSGGGAAVNFGAAVDDVLRAAAPEALVPPRYDPVLAADTWHRIADPGENGDGIEICFLSGPRGPEIWQRVNSGEPRMLGRTATTALHQLGLTACSVAMHTQEREGV